DVWPTGPNRFLQDEPWRSAAPEVHPHGRLHRLRLSQRVFARRVAGAAAPAAAQAAAVAVRLGQPDSTGEPGGSTTPAQAPARTRLPASPGGAPPPARQARHRLRRTVPPGRPLLLPARSGRTAAQVLRARAALRQNDHALAGRGPPGGDLRALLAHVLSHGV